MDMQRLNLLARAPLLLLVISGCRLNGGHATGPATYVEVGEARYQMERSYARALTDLGHLEEVSTSNSTLFGFVKPYRQILGDHAEAVERLRVRVATLSSRSSYRELNHALGAMTSERSVLEDRYAGLFTAMASAMGRRSTSGVKSGDAGYFLFPPHYIAIESVIAQIPISDAVGR